jgi:ribosomal protein S18 acetylase RimI-like enzyme
MLYTSNTDNILPHQLEGFFVDWPNKPSTETHLEMLKNSKVILAIDEKENKVVGFIQAITDHILSAYIPLLEVLPAYQNQGIGTELVKRMISELDHLYMIDLLCDKELQSYYEKIGMNKAFGMMIRNYNNQSGNS